MSLTGSVASSNPLHQFVDGLGALKEIFGDNTVSEIAINGPDEVYFFRDGKRIRQIPATLRAEEIFVAIDFLRNRPENSTAKENRPSQLKFEGSSMRIMTLSPPAAARPMISILINPQIKNSFGYFLAQDFIEERVVHNTVSSIMLLVAR